MEYPTRVYFKQFLLKAEADDCNKVRVKISCRLNQVIDGKRGPLVRPKFDTPLVFPLLNSSLFHCSSIKLEEM